jgi:hypothetical protein
MILKQFEFSFKRIKVLIKIYKRREEMSNDKIKSKAKIKGVLFI